MELNQPVPDLALPDLDGRMHRLAALRGTVVVVNFWSAECPWCERTDAHLLDLIRRLGGQAALLTIACNAGEPDDMLRAAAAGRGLRPVLRDRGSAAAAWQAQTTPHAFLVDPVGILRYRGAVDDVTFRQRNAGRWYVEEALAAVLSGRLPDPQETPPYGCTIVRPF